MNIFKLFAIAYALTLFNISYSQTGPGGIGSNDGNSDLIMWYRPDHGISTSDSSVSTWENAAGLSAFNLSESGTQQPDLIANAINGYDEISFNGSNRLETGFTLTNSNFITNQASSFVVAKADNTTQQSSVYTTAPLVNSTRFSCHLPWSNSVLFDIGSCCSNDSRIEVSGLSDLTNYSIWAYDAHPSTGKQLYRNENLLQNRSNTSTYSSHDTQLFNLGGNTSGSNGFSGDIAEIAIFKTKVNEAQRIIINNYLAAKYNQSLSDNDLYIQDDSTNGDFDHHVAGIGMASDNSSHSDAQGTGIVRINNPSGLTKNSYLFWGEETKDPTYNFTTNTTNYTEQLNSKWRVNRIKNPGNVSVTFDISTIDLSGLQNCSDLQLIIDNDDDFSSPTVYNLTISGDTATATDVSFKDNDYFTLRYIDQIVWDGNTYHNGSGASNAPDDTDLCLKLTIKSGGTAELFFNTHVREINVESGARLNVINSVLLEVEEDVTINGTINLFGESQLIQNHSNTSSNSGSGSLKIKQQGTTNLYNYNYWSAPVNRNGYWQIGYLEDSYGVINFTPERNADPTTSPITLSSRWLYSFNGETDNYNAWKRLSTTSKIVPGLGYIMKGSGAPTLEQNYTFKGLPNDGNYSFNVTAGNDILIGNPYPSALDADQFINDNLSVIDGTLSFWEHFETNNSHVLSQYEGGYAKYNLMMSLPALASNTELISGNGTASKPAPTGYIDIAQGFFVSIINTGTLVFSNGQRTFARASLDETTFYKTTTKKPTKATKDKRPKIRFAFTDPKGYTKFIGLGYDRHATYAYDKGYDAKSDDDLKNDLSWQSGHERLVIQALPKINPNDKLPLTIKISNSGRYKLGIDNIENIPNNMKIYLIDNIQNTYYNLRRRDAELILDANTTETNRFSIGFKKETTANHNFVNNKMRVVYYKATETLQLHIHRPLSEVQSLKIYNTLGLLVKTIKQPITNTISLSHLNDGIYFLKVSTKDSKLLNNIKFIKN